MVVDQIPHQWLLPHERFTNVIPCDGAKRELSGVARFHLVRRASLGRRIDRSGGHDKKGAGQYRHL
jgi:hypothetical protein